MAIYNGDKRDTTAFESTSFLQINSCGVQKIIRDDYIKITRKKDVVIITSYL